MIKGALTLRHPEYYLFFTETPTGRKAAREFLRRLNERTENRDKPVSIPGVHRPIEGHTCVGTSALLTICRAFATRCWWRMAIRTRWCPAATRSTWRVAFRTAELILYDDAGHGGIFQYHEAFVKGLEFLEA